MSLATDSPGRAAGGGTGQPVPLAPTHRLLESLTGETWCRQVKFVCSAEVVKDSMERGAGEE